MEWGHFRVKGHVIKRSIKAKEQVGTTQLRRDVGLRTTTRNASENQMEECERAEANQGGGVCRVLSSNEHARRVLLLTTH